MEVLKKTRYVYDINRGTVSDYVTDIYDGEAFCTCPYFLYHHKYCKHVKKLLKEISEVEMKLNIKNPLKEYPSSLDNLNEIYGENLYNSRQIVGIYGKPNIGKSLFATQESFYLASMGYNVLYIDTEGSAESMIKAWSETFEERFGSGNGEITLVSKLELESLFEFLGWKAGIYWKSSRSSKGKEDKGKLEFRVVEQLKNSELSQIIEDNNIDFIILDSITSPIRRFTYEQQNFPARSSCIAFILKELVKMMEKYEVGVLVTNHASWNPAAMPHEKGVENIELSGGVVIHHYLKRVLYLDKRGTSAAKNYRRFWLVRSENHPEFSRAVIAKIDDEGYHEVTDKKTIATMFTGHELTLIEND